MAGVKITDLGILTAPVAEDLLYIVDISDNSQSPQGTSKQIELGNILSSSSYSPTISGETNNIAVNVNAASYIRVGNIVTVSAQLGITMDAGETTGAFEIELPVASDFTTVKQCFGILQWSFAGILAEIVELSIGAEVTNNTCAVSLETTTAAIALEYCTLQFQYEILS
jgi:hypothetical protein